MWDFVKKTIAAVAPMIGTALGGPIGGAAGRILGEILCGNENASPQEIEQGLKKATPDQLAQIKKAELQFEVQMKKLGIDRDKLEMMDRDSARAREVAMARAGMRDWTTPILSMVVTVGFFALLICIFFYPIEGSMKSIAEVMIGSLGTAWLMIIAYYFGSSLGSRKKDGKTN